MPAERLVVGRIVKPHGIRGELLIEPLTESNDRFAAGAVVWVGDPGGTTRRATVATVRPSRDWLIISLRGVGDRTEAERLRGALISIPAGVARPLEAGRYYPHEIEGFDVVDEKGVALGTLTGVLENPANDVWVVRSGDRDVLVPAVNSIVRSVDTEKRIIIVNAIPGLFED